MHRANDVLWPTRVARSVLQAHAEGTLIAQYGLVERAWPAALPAVPATRLGVQANYLTDLGVRGMDEAAVFLAEHLKLQELPEAGEPVERLVAAEWAARHATGEHSDTDLCAVIDAQVCFAGAWATARELVSAVLESGAPLRSPGALLYAAVVAGGDANPPVADELFKLAGKAAPREADALLVALRQAAYTLKRRARPQEALTLLAELVRDAGDAERRRALSPADAATVRALAMNLEALALLKSGRHDDAYKTVRHALTAIPREGWVLIDRDAGFRYRCQIRTNVAQMQFKRGDPAAAVRTLDDNLAENRVDHPESVGETLSIAAYFHYREQDFARALELISEAYRLIRLEGAPDRLRGCRKIAVAALHCGGRATEAEQVLRRVERDPLGFDEEVH
ncbi:hypothetical protein [Amycolatopsis sp. WQ 127309]|uniref:hypothetical protein n=1 Tax=Amycolatopsis sp. WQ 127309 TaxID=2932773 RepID=UPI001FF33A0B|nr:hypothetical protein [Amycolatopsis sp. WQ 127309]UOZ10698.1 hypothetical protein MUY22_21500 [Amycolatopsis sp. WQ 127309]